MSFLAFDNNVRRQIQNVIEFAAQNIYQVDDILDMMNGDLVSPGQQTEHLVLVPIGQWICYYLVDHPIKNRCHYFLIKPDATGQFPTKEKMEYIMNQFGVETPLLDEHISIDKEINELKIVIQV